MVIMKNCHRNVLSYNIFTGLDWKFLSIGKVNYKVEEMYIMVRALIGIKNKYRKRVRVSENWLNYLACHY